jgi:hypothetical protein
MKRVLFVFLSLLLSHTCFSQYYAVGEDPSSVKFSYIETPHFRVVFPNPIQVQALHLAAMLEQSYDYTQFDKKINTKKIQVLIHTKNSISNGFVSWAPKRMELMSLPPHSFEAMSWSRELAIHEFRHVSQISTLYKSLTGLSYYILGEQGIGLMTSLVPLWFYEGDAVTSETAYTQSGRGRNADFNLEYRTRLAEGLNLKFDQYLNGSYKIPIPDHYHLGYHMVSYARAAYGDDIWNKVARYTTNYPFLLAPFSFGIKKYTNNTREQLFRKSLIFYDSSWSKLSNKLNQETISKNSIKDYSDYTYPLRIKDDIYAFKNTLSRNPQLVRINSSGKEKVLKTIGSIDSSPFSDGENIYWTEYMYAGRWMQVKKSIIRKYSIINNSYSTLSDHKYYSYPTIKGDSLATLQNLPSNKLSIGLYSKDFKRLNEYAIPYEQAKDLQWVANNLAYVTLDSHDNMMVVQQSLSSNKIDTLLNFGRKNMSCVKVSVDSITFISDYSGKSCLYSFKLSTKTFNKLYEPSYGINSYDIISPSKFITSEYSLNGYKLEEHTINPTPVQGEDITTYYPVANLLSKNVGINLQDSITPVHNFKVHKYNKFTHLFNFHSWAPFYFDPAEIQELNLNIHPGFTLVSQNLLSTSFTTLGYGYTPEGHIINVSQTFKGWMPVINFQFDRYTTKPTLYSLSNHPYVMDSSLHRFKVAVSSYLPLQFSCGAWSSLIQPFIEYSHYNDILYNSSNAKYEKGLNQITTSFYGAIQMKLAHQNIFPRWGINFYFKTTAAPFEEGNLGRLYAYRLGIITPGLFKNHGFMTRLCYQNQEVDRYYYSNAFILPRGYNYTYRSNYYRAVFNDYSLPIAYPDFNLSWLVYLKRIRLNLFADFAENTSMYYVKDKSNKIIGKIYPETYYSSTGMDILFDLNLLRSTFPITAGARVSYNNDRTTTWNTVFSINFN